MSPLAEAQAALTELRASAGYKAARLANPTASKFAATHVGLCEIHLENVIAELTVAPAALPLLMRST